LVLLLLFLFLLLLLALALDLVELAQPALDQLDVRLRVRVAPVHAQALDEALAGGEVRRARELQRIGRRLWSGPTRRGDGRRRRRLRRLPGDLGQLRALFLARGEEQRAQVVRRVEAQRAGAGEQARALERKTRLLAADGALVLGLGAVGAQA